MPKLFLKKIFQGDCLLKFCERSVLGEGAAEAPPWLVDVLLMAVPKKRRSYTRKRIRQAGLIRMRGPKPKDTIYTCPVCERMRQPHRVCEREDCSTLMQGRWF